MNTFLAALTKSADLAPAKQALALQQTAATIGFDWPRIDFVFDKLAEEILELKQAIAEQADHDHLTDELGDILFCCINLGRHLNIDSEHALSTCNRKFIHRFEKMAYNAEKTGNVITDMSLDELEQLWQHAKQ